MNFFEHQDHARRLTGRFVALFALAVVLIVVALNGVMATIYLFGVAGQTQFALTQVPTRLYVYTTLITLAVITLGSLYRMARLARGGEAVAELMGARPVDPGTQDPRERRLLHVVEEMAIASGSAMPRVYLMERQGGINAFAAGHTPSDAVVAVTRGALERLDRQELQGVIAHEFSHILHGDMRLNLRLLGVLNGILVIGGLGLAILRGMRTGRVRSSGRGSGQAVAVLLFIGLALTVIGYAGVFCARLIKSAVSRQREFLADASAVQFTRDPDGISGALQKIHGDTGSLIQSVHAEDVSHMLFAEGLSSRMAGWMATHPPLDERIRRIDPEVDLDRLQALALAGESGSAANEALAGAAAFASAPTPVAATAEQLVEQVGRPGPVQLQYARAFLSALPAWLQGLLGRPPEAASVSLGLLLPPDTAGPEQAVVRERCGRGVLAEAERVAEALARLGPRFRLPILSLALPALRRLDRDERAALLETLDAVVRADRRVTLAEFVIVSVVRNQISERTPSRVRFQDLEALHTDCALVLSLLTQAGGTPNQARARVYTEAMGDLGVAGAGLIGVELIELADVEQAMARLAEAAPRLQARIIEACARVVLADAKISVAEGELLRAVALAMGCPLPPIIDAHPGSGLPQSADKAQAAA